MESSWCCFNVDLCHCTTNFVVVLTVFFSFVSFHGNATMDERINCDWKTYRIDDLTFDVGVDRFPFSIVAMGNRGFSGGDVLFVVVCILGDCISMTEICPLCGRFRTDVRVVWFPLISFFPLMMTLCAFSGCADGWISCAVTNSFCAGFDRGILRMSAGVGFLGNIGGCSKLVVRMNGARDTVEPAKLFRRLAELNFVSGSLICRMCDRISSTGGGGNESLWFNEFASFSCWCMVGGGGGKSGLGTRNDGFLGGRSGFQSSIEIIGPITTGPMRSLDSALPCFCRCWSRYMEYSEADDVLKRQRINVIQTEFESKRNDWKYIPSRFRWAAWQWRWYTRLIDRL